MNIDIEGLIRSLEAEYRQLTLTTDWDEEFLSGYRSAIKDLKIKVKEYGEM